MPVSEALRYPARRKCFPRLDRSASLLRPRPQRSARNRPFPAAALHPGTIIGPGWARLSGATQGGSASPAAVLFSVPSPCFAGNKTAMNRSASVLAEGFIRPPVGQSEALRSSRPESRSAPPLPPVRLEVLQRFELSGTVIRPGYKALPVGTGHRSRGQNKNEEERFNSPSPRAPAIPNLSGTKGFVETNFSRPKRFVGPGQG